MSSIKFECSSLNLPSLCLLTLIVAAMSTNASQGRRRSTAMQASFWSWHTPAVSPTAWTENWWRLVSWWPVQEQSPRSSVCLDCSLSLFLPPSYNPCPIHWQNLSACPSKSEQRYRERQAGVGDGQLPGFPMPCLFLIAVFFWGPDVFLPMDTVEDWITGPNSSLLCGGITHSHCCRASWGDCTSLPLHTGLGCVTYFGQWNGSRCDAGGGLISLDGSCTSASAMKITYSDRLWFQND